MHNTHAHTYLPPPPSPHAHMPFLIGLLRAPTALADNTPFHPLPLPWPLRPPPPPPCRLNVDGLRGDLVINRAAKALVALEGRTEVTKEDIERVISSCLNHRCVQACMAGWGGGVCGACGGVIVL